MEYVSLSSALNCFRSKCRLELRADLAPTQLLHRDQPVGQADSTFLIVHVTVPSYGETRLPLAPSTVPIVDGLGHEYPAQNGGIGSAGLVEHPISYHQQQSPIGEVGVEIESPFDNE